MTPRDGSTPTLSRVDAELIDALSDAATTVKARASDRLAAAHDASHYLLTPRAVVIAENHREVATVLAATQRLGVPVTFRSGGTSLSGQAGTDGVLIDTRRAFRRVTVLDDGARVRAQPGATVRSVNLRLLRHGTKLGPDPASEIACTVGGVVSNNSSGMTCGVEQNTYQTLGSAVIVLPSGTIVDTGQADVDQVLRDTEPELHAGLLRLRDRVRSNPESVATVRALFSIKNTMGYGLNSFLDHDRAADILEHLVIGSEGTLAFLAEATFRTVPIKKHVATGLLVFPTLTDATSALPDLVAAGFAVIELLDAASLGVSQRDPEATDDLLSLQVDRHAALLVEFQEASEAELAERLITAQNLFATLPTSWPGELSSAADRRARLWHIRKGLYTLIAGSRPSGSTALLEDIAVPVERLNTTCDALIRIFERHGYDDSVIFGHAKDGNIHFMLTERFDSAESSERYKQFTDAMVELVLAQGGTLKAEHGTGRVMAPFVRRQYGDELYNVMREIKQLFDPKGLMNPGVILNDDPASYLQNLKPVPIVESEVDRCVECGYCEPVCPSRDITTTPRERIVLRREMALAEQGGDQKLLDQLRTEYQYDAIDTCAVDGMCETACPVLINTGDLVRRLRAENANALDGAVWHSAAGHWNAMSRAGSVALSVARRLPSPLPRLATDVGRAVLGKDAVPRYSSELPGGGRARPTLTARNPQAVYFASCTTTMFGPAGDGSGVAESFQQLCRRAGIDITTPDGLPSLCCGTPWKSKGYTDGYERMKTAVVGALRAATRDGELPVVCDASSCTEGLRVMLAAADEARITVLDSVEFVAEQVLPLLPEGRRIETLALHPTCSSTRMGINDSLLAVAEAVANDVLVPDDWGCCGFAGDRGMLHPELTASATALEAAEVTGTPTRAYASVNRTCELGMTRATGEQYRHVLELLNEATR